jgi:hypothetical protein
MDRITQQSPRQRGYGSTSSLRNDSLKHTRKHEKGREESNQEAKLTGSGRPSGQEGRTVRPGGADRPHWSRGPSGLLARTVRANTADRPALRRGPSVKSHRTNRSNLRKRTVRGEHADCPPGTRGPSARCCGPSETPSNQNSKLRRIKTKGEKEHEEHRMNSQPADRPRPTRGPSAPRGQSRKLLDLEGQLPQIIIGFPKRLKLWRQEFGDLKSVTQRCYSPKILPPNSLNHRESRIL